MTLAAVSCSGGAASAGTALVPGYGTVFGLAPVKPGTELGLLYVSLHNRSRSPITISSITGVGTGIGSVINVAEVKIAPAEAGNKSVPGGAYQVDPPVDWWSLSRACGKQVLVSARGFRLAAGGLARVWMIIRAARPGQFFVRAHLVRYVQDGVSYQQIIPTGYRGSVRNNAPFIPIWRFQARCIESEGARPLPGQYLRNPERPIP